MAKKPAATSQTQKLREFGADWIKRIDASTKGEKEWLDDAAMATRAYTNEEKAEEDEKTLGKRYDFNILYANVETIVPAVINSPPVPDIRRRFNDEDPAARVVADIMERAMSIQIDDSRLQIELEAAAQDSFLAGRGIVRLKFKSDIVGGEPTKDEIAEAADYELGTAAHDGGDEPLDGDYTGGSAGDVLEPAGGGSLATAGAQLSGAGEPERSENERITFEAVSWKDYRHGKAKRWEDRPWDAFRFVVEKDDANDSFDSDLIRSQFDDDGKNAWSASSSDICGWEIWDKKSKKVYFVSDDGVLLKQIDDPLGLTQFFCIATPMQPIEVTGRLKPVNPFSIYRKLADQLDTITKRIDVITKAMKVKGWYSGEADDLKDILSLDDNEFAPIQNAELWAKSAGGLAGAVVFWPLDKFIAALRELYTARNETKQAIYEITGISDIVRGASSASETATAQNIKSQWGSLRIQKMQRMMERCARDLFVMMSEIIPSNFALQTLETMTGIPILPAPTDTPEERDTKIKVIALLKQRIATYYRVDVESDSTIRADLTRQKQEVAQFLQGASAYFAAVAPLVQEGALPADAAVEIFAATSRMFNLGKSVEDTLEKMVTEARAKAEQARKAPPQGQQTDPVQQAAAAKTAAEAQATQQASQQKAQQFEFDMQRQAQEANDRMQESARKAEADGAKAQREAVIATMEQELKGLEIQIKQLDLQIKRVELADKMNPSTPEVVTQ